MTHPETASLKEFARILGGVKPGYVSQLKRDGRLVMADDGKQVRVPESLQRIADTRDPSKAGVAARHASNRDAPESPAADVAGAAHGAVTTGSGSAAAGDKVGGTYQAARAVRERYLALEAKRSYEQAMGKLVDAADVASAVGATITQLRARLEGLPAVVAAQLAAERDEAAVVALLSTAIADLLDETSRQLMLASRTGG